MALTSKERKALRSMANTLETTLIIGKDDVNEGVAAHADELLDQHELVKGSVLETSDLTARQAADALSERCGADCVQVIGRKFVLFRPSPRDDVAHIQFGPDGEARVIPAPKPAKKRSPKKRKRPVKPRSAIKARLAREEREAAVYGSGVKRTFRPVQRAARPAGDDAGEGGPARRDGAVRIKLGAPAGRPSNGGPSARRPGSDRPGFGRPASGRPAPRGEKPGASDRPAASRAGAGRSYSDGGRPAQGGRSFSDGGRAGQGGRSGRPSGYSGGRDGRPSGQQRSADGRYQGGRGQSGRPSGNRGGAQPRGGSSRRPGDHGGRSGR